MSYSLETVPEKPRFNPRPLFYTAGLLLLILAGFWAYNKFVKKPQVEGPGQYQLAVWEWRGPDSFLPDTLASNLEFAANENIKTIYIHIGEVIDINEVDDPAEKAKQLTDFNTALRQFTQQAHRNGIDVHGLAGSVQWSDPDYRYLPLQIMDYVVAYNSQVSPEERLDGVQYDIEFYNKKDFKESKQKNIDNFLVMSKQIHDKFVIAQKADTKLKLGFAIPYWFDNENGNIPDVTYNGTEKPVGYHLFDMLNATPNGYVAIMDYRNKAEGKNGSIEQARNEVRYASQKAKNVQVVIGQLINVAKPESTTFYGQEPQKMYNEMNKLDSHFANNPNYDGLAVHDFKAFKKQVED